MRIRQTVKYSDQRIPDYVNDNYPIHYITDQNLRHGFEQGNYTRVTIEIKNNNVIIYELVEEKIKKCSKNHSINTTRDQSCYKVFVTCDGKEIIKGTWTNYDWRRKWVFDNDVEQWIDNLMKRHNEESND